MIGRLVRILYLDIDCLRPDHLGCYGYHRDTSPNIDKLAKEGLRFDNVYVSDAPCLPSRSALFSQRFGAKTGIVNHGGARAAPYSDGVGRGFGDSFGRTSWMRAFRDAGYFTASVSPFAERHAAWHFYAGFRDIVNTGKRGLEIADEVFQSASDWLDRNGKNDSWVLHVNFWDPHTPYRAPKDFGEPFASQALPNWYSKEVRKQHFSQPGPHSAQESMGFDDESNQWAKKFPRQPFVIDSMDEARRMFDGYDTGVAYADKYCGLVLEKLEALGIRDSTAILLSSDHGENLGELNVYGDHQTADQFTCRVPAILSYPGVTEKYAGQVDSRLHYQIDVGATLTNLAGGKPFPNWDSKEFSQTLGSKEGGRSELVLSQAAWACQRSVRFESDGKSWLWLRTYHDAYHGYDDEMLFDLGSDKHEEINVARENKAICEKAKHLLDDWLAKNLGGPQKDPLDEVLREGGPFHVRGKLGTYLTRLRETGREDWAARLASKYGID